MENDVKIAFLETKNAKRKIRMDHLEAENAENKIRIGRLEAKIAHLEENECRTGQGNFKTEDQSGFKTSSPHLTWVFDKRNAILVQ